METRGLGGLLGAGPDRPWKLTSGRNDSEGTEGQGHSACGRSAYCYEGFRRSDAVE